MLDRDSALATMSEAQLEEWEPVRLAAIERLPDPLRPAAWGLLGFDRRGQIINRNNGQPWRPDPAWAAIADLEAMGAADRQLLFEAVMPKIAAAVEASWQMQKRLPYQASWARRAFRAPQMPGLTLRRRGDWLRAMVTLVKKYDRDVLWLAQNAAYLSQGWWNNCLGMLFAAAIDSPGPAGDEVFDTLMATGSGDAESGAMGRHVIRGLLSASRPEGWEMVERLLLAAQRQEGLRQVVLESVDEAHPQAFHRMVHLIREHNLVRFSSVVRAVDVWFGMNWQADEARTVRQIIEQMDDLLGDREACEAIIARADIDPQKTYLAFAILAFSDVQVAFTQAEPLLAHDNVQVRFVATVFLSHLLLPEAVDALAPMLMDVDLRVATRAFTAVRPSPYVAGSELPPDFFERLEEALPRFPARKKTLEPLVWPWMTITSERRDVADKLVDALDERPFKRLLPYVSLMSPITRGILARTLGKNGQSADADARECLFDLLGDRSTWVRQAAVKTAAEVQVSEGEAQRLEEYLTRKGGDLRRGVLRLLLNQEVDRALASAGRLLAAKNNMQRQGGLELLRQLKEEERAVDRCRLLADEYVATGQSIPAADQHLLDAILDRQGQPPTLDDGLGLFDPAERTPLLSPKVKNESLSEQKSWVTPAAVKCLHSLDELVHQHRETPVTIQFGREQREELLANANSGLFSIFLSGTSWKAPQTIQLKEIWQNWQDKRPAELRDEDGLELLRALTRLTAGQYERRGQSDPVPGWFKKGWRILFHSTDSLQLRYPYVLHQVLWWLVSHLEAPEPADYLLDAAESSLSLLPSSEEERAGYPISRLLGWPRIAKVHRDIRPADWSGEQHIRIWQISRWLDEIGVDDHFYHVSIDEIMRAFQAGGANETDILTALIGPRRNKAGLYSHFGELGSLSSRNPEARYGEFAEDPALLALVERCRRRIMSVEMERGDIPTAASRPAMALQHSGGLDELAGLLAALGRETFLRAWSYDSSSKKSVFSRLIRATYPDEVDTPERFGEVMERAGINRKRLIETALYAPQWANHVEFTLEWTELADAVGWFHVHTKGHRWAVAPAIRNAWNAQVYDQTPLSSRALMDGAVDVAWFNRVYAALGEERWRELERAAKYVSGGGGHKRSQLFANAMAGRLDEGELRDRIRGKRHQDSVRALGLLPLPEGAGRDSLILERYLLIQEFRRGSRKFGSQRQASEGLAARISMENLARTAGYADPLRLEWAMEAQAVADLADGPVTVTAEDISVTLAIDEWGAPQIRVDKNGRRLKSVPRRVKKQDEVAGLLARKKDIVRQASRARGSLESAMCRGDTFTAGELQELLKHPVLSPMLAQLVFLSSKDGEVPDKIGYPVNGGRKLEQFDGEATSLATTDALRIAHAHDLLLSGQWHLWQRECFRRERIQPFKQVFRELYVLTTAEEDDGTISRRYAGHQVNTRQALALLGQRGWLSDPEEGIHRTYHDEGILAWLACAGLTYTPADVEGLTIEGIRFNPWGQWQPLPLATVPARLFSEVMRDVDLVVSVAHQGGVDPEVTASTTEMRAALIRETCDMLKIGNVRLQDSHVLIDGGLNNYTVHLGSGVVHQQPGGALCLVPVHSQQRGRIFLPFADDDPKTAEVVAKVLLLARDEKIKDPTILEQITPG